MRILLALAALVAALGLAGNFDFEEEQQQQDRYCEFVADGTWPAYNPDIQCN
tara:strand:- start:2337 stop:2492 length:156 start_codon:yes stop_codon:yes gene_type:complete